MFPIEIAIDRGFLSPNFFRSTLVGLPRQPKGVTGLLQIHRLSRRSWPGTAVEFCGSSEANDIFVFKQIASIPNFRTQLSASVLKIFFGSVPNSCWFFWSCPLMPKTSPAQDPAPLFPLPHRQGHAIRRLDSINIGDWPSREGQSMDWSEGF